MNTETYAEILRARWKSRSKVGSRIAKACSALLVGNQASIAYYSSLLVIFYQISAL